jgi:hypothetical protein
VLFGTTTKLSEAERLMTLYEAALARRDRQAQPAPVQPRAARS